MRYAPLPVVTFVENPVGFNQKCKMFHKYASHTKIAVLAFQVIMIQPPPVAAARTSEICHASYDQDFQCFQLQGKSNKAPFQLDSKTPLPIQISMLRIKTFTATMYSFVEDETTLTKTARCTTDLRTLRSFISHPLLQSTAQFAPVFPKTC